VPIAVGDGLFVLIEGRAQTLLDTKGLLHAGRDSARQYWGLDEGLIPFGNEEGKWGVLTRDGGVLVEPKYDLVLGFSEGMSAFLLDGKVGYIDRRGEVVIEPQFVEGGPFIGGLARVYDGGKCWYIRYDGSTAIEGPFDVADNFSQGLAWVKPTGEAHYGYIDRTGAVAIGAKFDTAARFSDGLAAVTFFEARDGATSKVAGYINKTGRLAIELPNPREHCDFDDGLALVRYQDRMEYIDRKGRTVWEGTEDWAPGAVPVPSLRGIGVSPVLPGR